MSALEQTFSLIIFRALQARQTFLNTSPTEHHFFPDLPLQAEAMHSHHRAGDENNLIKKLIFFLKNNMSPHSIPFLSMTWVYLCIKLPCKHNSVVLKLGGWSWWGLHTHTHRVPAQSSLYFL